MTRRQVTHNSHFNSPCRNGGIFGAPHETVINIIDAPAKIRFRVASCADPEHSTFATTAHCAVADIFKFAPSETTEPAA